MHISIPVENTIEIINVTPVNPLISKCQIKVCYVGDEPNRNRSIITKDVATKLANSIPGSPIVGFYNEHEEDFEEHNRSIEIANGQIRVKELTRPYGFVDLNAKVWFQKFMDEGIEREYLVTEGWLWTGQYPECARIVEKGNNHSMELDDKIIDAYWTKDGNGKPKFFIINEAIMSKLCILGENSEPCFEGSHITAPKVQFSFDNDTKALWSDFIFQMKELIKEGGTSVKIYAVKIGDPIWNALYGHKEETYSINAFFEEEDQKYAVLQNESNYYRLNFSIGENDEVVFAEEMTDITESYTPATEAQFALADVEAFEVEFKKNKEEDDDKKKKPEDKTDDGKGSEGDDDDDEEEKKKKQKKYNLEEVEEYQALVAEHETLKNDFNAYKQTSESTIADLNNTIASLTEFKNSVERKEKEHMINVDFCMLDESLKKDVIDNIDKYSLDDIEAKLSIICVRNKVSFNLDDDDNKNKGLVYNLNDDHEDDDVPAWVKAVQATAKAMNE